MKKSVFTRIFVLIFSLALLIGSVVCVAASADESDEYGIEAINISHGDKIRVLIAVDAPVEAAENIVVKYTYAGDEYVAKYWKNDAIYGDETLYPIFYTVGIAAKDMGEDITAWVGEDDSDARDVSVVSYLYNRLYREGFITKTEGKDANRKELYLKLLDYGAKAQQVLWNNVEGNEPRTLVTDYSYVSVTDGSINDGGSTALVAGDVTVDYTGGSPDFRGWDITAYIDGEAVTSRSYKSQLKMEAGISFTATPYMNANLFHFEDIAVGTGWKYIGDEATKNGDNYTAAVLQQNGTLPTLIVPVEHTSIAGGSKNEALGSVVEVAGDEDNKYLKVTATGRTFNSNSEPLQVYFNAPSATAADYSGSVMEFDVKIVSTTAGSTAKLFTLYFHRTSGTTVTTVTPYVKNGNFVLNYGGTDYVVGAVGAWAHVKIEYEKSTKLLTVSANGTKLFELTASGGDGSILKDMQIVPNGGFKTEMHFDNYSVEHIPAAE